VGRYQKGKTSLDFTEARDSEWQWHLLSHMQVYTLFHTDNTRDRKWNANKSVSLAPAIICFQCRLRASSGDFSPIVSKMAAKTTSGSGFDRKLGLVAPGFHI